MGVLSGSLAGALGRPDLVYSVQPQQAVVGGPPTAIAGSSSSLTGSANVSVGMSGGRSALALLMLLIIGYGAFAYWVRPHLA